MSTQRISLKLPKLPQDLDYLSWQKSAIKQVDEKWSVVHDYSNKPVNPNSVVIAVPGSGKSFLQLALGFSYLNSKQIDRFIILVPTSSLVDQMADDAISLQLGLNKNDLDPLDNRPAVLTYCKLAQIVEKDPEMLTLLKDTRFLVIADEAHHLAIGKESYKFSEAFKALSDWATFRLFTTGTPFRSKRYERIPYCDYDPQKDGTFLLKSDFHFSRWEAEEQRVIIPISYHAQIPTEDLTGKSKSDIYAVSLSNHPHPAFQSALCKFDHYLQESRKGFSHFMGLMILQSIDDCIEAKRQLDDLFPGKYRSICVHSRDKNSYKELNRMTTRREDTGYDVIFSVKAVSEGVSIKQLKVLLLWTNQQTDTLLAQMLGRIVRVYPNVPYEKQFAHLIYLDEPGMTAHIQRYKKEIMPATTRMKDYEIIRESRELGESREARENVPIFYDIDSESHAVIENRQEIIISDDEYKKAENKSRECGHRYTPEQILQYKRMQDYLGQL